MTDPTTLADRVEALAGPDRKVDLAICLALNTGRSTNPRNPGAPAYTSSLDAALTLVPEGFFWSITMRGERRGGFHACCVEEGPLVWHEAATAPLALTCAALRAHAERMK